jgi:glycerol-3-phosphate dehydrogenase (NAD(P)+)
MNAATRLQKRASKTKSKMPASLQLKAPYRIVLFGQGQWGGALGECFRSRGHQVRFVDLGDSKEVHAGELIILATPFRVIHEYLNLWRQRKDLLGVINASKGIDRETLMTFSSLAQKILKVPFGTLSGPTFARELSEKKPTACVLATKNEAWGKRIAEELSCSYFRIYSHHDPRGVEVCAAVKNVLAIGAGISDGLQLGHNAKAALLSRGLMEMMKITKALGGKPASVFGLAGMGDLWLTATGDLSRNRKFGELLARGRSPQEAAAEIGQTVEGIYTVEQVYRILKKKKLQLPICEQVYQVSIHGKAPREAIESLMGRDLKVEESSRFQLKI